MANDDNKRFLGNFKDKDDAVALRDDIAKRLVDMIWTPEITVGYEFMHGVGGWGVWLYKDEDASWPENVPIAWQAALLIKQSEGRNHRGTQ
jgi:hypothetical protein